MNDVIEHVVERDNLKERKKNERKRKLIDLTLDNSE